MKKLVLIGLLCLLIVPTVAFGQADWDYAQEIPVESLGIRFNVPDGWVSKVDDTTGATYAAESQDDLDILGDGDSSTNPAGFAVAVSGFPLEGSGMEDTSLEDIATTFSTQSQMDVSDSGNVTVNLRPAVYLLGTSQTDGSTSYLGIWKQDGNLILLGMLLPSGADVTDDMGFAFGIILGTVRPLVSEDFVAADDRYEVTDLGFSLNYPADWTTADTATSCDSAGASGVVFAESEDDICNEAPEATLISIVQLQGTLADLNIEDDATTQDMVDALATVLGIEDVTSQGEFVVNGYPGVGFTGTSSTTGRPGFGIVTHDEDDGLFTIYILTAADEDTVTEYTPVFGIMLWSIQPLES